MFQSSAKRLRALLSLAEDVLGDPPEPEAPHPHPHRRPLRWEHQRRPGSVPPHPAHCLSPVRSGPGSERRDRVR